MGKSKNKRKIQREVRRAVEFYLREFDTAEDLRQLYNWAIGRDEVGVNDWLSLWADEANLDYNLFSEMAAGYVVENYDRLYDETIVRLLGGKQEIAGIVDEDVTNFVNEVTPQELEQYVCGNLAGIDERVDFCCQSAWYWHFEEACLDEEREEIEKYFSKLYRKEFHARLVKLCSK